MISLLAQSRIKAARVTLFLYHITVPCLPKSGLEHRMTSPSKFPKISFTSGNVSAAFSLPCTRSRKALEDKVMSSKSTNRYMYVSWASGELATKLDSIARCVEGPQEGKYTTVPLIRFNATLKLPRLRYTCTVLAPDRAGRECLYKSSVTTSCFFLHHITASLLPKKNFSSTMFAPLSKKILPTR